jgi:hypothetical protein
MHIDELIEKLKGIREVEGNVQVFLNIGEEDRTISDINVGQAEHWLDSDAYLGTGVEDYHQICLIEGPRIKGQ